MKRFNFIKHFYWISYTIFSILVINANWDALLISLNHGMAFGNILIWLLFFSFSGYTIYCTRKSLFFKSLESILAMNWGIQITIDLAIGLILSVFFTYFLTGSIITACWWGISFIAFGNISTLLLFAINYDKLVAIFHIQG